MHWIANTCYLFAGLIYLPVLLFQMIAQRKNRRGWRERFGRVSPRLGERDCVWIHGVSLGEINATRVLVQKLGTECPEIEIVISTTTDTGYARALQLYPELTVFRYPLDFSWVIGRVLRRIRPSVIVLMELEVWYNLVTQARREGISICVANGRFTKRSASRLSLLGFVVRPMFAGLSWVGAQTEEIAGRFRVLGVPAERVEVLGSMKWDTAVVADHIEGQDDLVSAMAIRKDVPLVVLGSSGPGEEQRVLNIFGRIVARRVQLQLALVPRKPERFDEVARLVERSGYLCLRRSQLPDGGLPPTDIRGKTVHLGDTMGELRKFYSLAHIVIVGRTLVPMGGSDPMEIAALGKCIITGPHVENFSEPVDRLLADDAISLVHTDEQLETVLKSLLEDDPARREMGRRAQQTVLANQGASARTLQQIKHFVLRQPGAA